MKTYLEILMHTTINNIVVTGISTRRVFFIHFSNIIMITRRPG